MVRSCLWPTLESAFFSLPVAGKCNLWDLVAQQLDNHFVDDIAHLVVAADQLASAVTDAAGLIGHEGIAGRILSANIAVDATPAFVAFAVIARSHGSVAATGQRAAN